MKKVVVDASVVRWFVEEEYTMKALILRDSYRVGLVDMAVPSIISYVWRRSLPNEYKYIRCPL